ncbi:hypothetical protein KC332_g3332 [Hortaea werneckii]|nr:hypothetical protein KC358_g6847 [Hortaea werneckii]KAI6848857.1 hypothetical protein KC350_g2843 [Hortaea werneckii]KAI6930017.1 hypothetical protein KC348_g7692 [Hortaea werneckii]KAI6935172.1 hypothetical protein KC341_g7104 [Hortaea werneckii]KAI6966374.1 hypothetical protein KC321_g9592 [Hortaea werneckii]
MDERDKPLGFFDLPRELRNIIYQQCGHYKLREGSPTIDLVEVELTKHCCLDLRLVNWQFKSEFEEEMSRDRRRNEEASLSICIMNTPKAPGFRPVSNMFAATARGISHNLFAVSVIRVKRVPNGRPQPTFAQTILSILPSTQLQCLTLTCSIDRPHLQNTVAMAREFLDRFRSISTFRMQIHQWLMPRAYFTPDQGELLVYERVVEYFQDFKLQQGLSFDFEVQPLFRSILMVAVGGSDEVREMFESSEETGENTIIYRGVPSNSKYAYRGFELFVHAVNVGDDLQAYFSS